MIIPLGTDDFVSASENIQRLRLRNMYLTDNPTSPDGISRVSRPTLTLLATIGTGPIYGMWRQDATFDGDWFVVSGEELYRYDGTATLIDDIPGDGYCQFAGASERVIIIRDGTAFSYDGATLDTVTMPDDVPLYDPVQAPVSDVAYINGYFLLPVLGTGRFYWMEDNEADPDPLDFATAERSPDAITAVEITSDEVWFIGTQSVEVWTPTGDPEDPFARVNGRVYNEGCTDLETVEAVTVEGIPSIIWVTDTKSVVLARGNTSTISTESVEELLRTATNLRAWSFRHNRHDFYVLTADEFTLALDLNRKNWCRWDSYGLDNLLAHQGLQSGASVYAGSYVDGKIYQLVEGVSDDGLPVIREVSGYLDNPGEPQPLSKLTVRVNAGWSPEYGDIPVLEVRWSQDQGTTWSNYKQMPLGDKGEYNKDVTLRSLGLIKRPGRTFEFRFSELARFRLDYAVVNE